MSRIYIPPGMFAGALSRMVYIISLWLSATAARACTVCRPRVEAGIHNSDFSGNLLLVLLPVVLVLLGGLILYFAADLRHRFSPPRA